jgi:hypothetical protein
MFDSLGSFLQIASSVLVITACASAAFLQARVSNLRGSLTDLRAEVGDKDREIAKMQALRTLDKAELVKQGHDLDALRRVVTGEAHWVAIGQKARGAPQPRRWPTGAPTRSCSGGSSKR